LKTKQHQANTTTGASEKKTPMVNVGHWVFSKKKGRWEKIPPAPMKEAANATKGSLSTRKEASVKMKENSARATTEKAERETRRWQNIAAGPVEEAATKTATKPAAGAHKEKAAARRKKKSVGTTEEKAANLIETEDERKKKQANLWTDLGAGCCSGGRSERNGKLFGGYVRTLDDCKSKCLESGDKCGVVEYGWESKKEVPSQWCFIWSTEMKCRRMDRGKERCGYGGDNGVHAYMFRTRTASFADYPSS